MKFAKESLKTKFETTNKVAGLSKETRSLFD